MDIEGILRESRAKDLLKPLDFQTQAGKDQFQKQLLQFTPNTGILQRRQETILALRKTLTSESKQQLEATFERVSSLEPALDVFFKRTNVESDSYGQLLFSSWKSLQVLNTLPFVLLLLSFYKQYVVPALAVLMPLIIVVMPFVFLKWVYKLPISPKQYSVILMNMLGVQNLDMRNPRTILQGSLTLFSIGQSIYQPIQNAIHLQTIHKDMLTKAQALQSLLDCLQTLETHISFASSCNYNLHDIQDEDTHRLFATFWDSPYRLRLALSLIGDYEVLYRMAKMETLYPVQFLQGTKPSLDIQNGIDPFLHNPIPFEVHLRGKGHHAILTGPNRGGKSSVLRATLLNVVLAQTFGFSYANLKLRPFDWIATGLRLEDRPGSSSMFESEVEFSIQILQRAKNNPDQIGFVLFDELFHSTNPPDGARTADIFLQKLWKTTNTASFISTHVFDLAKKAHPRIQKLCVPAVHKENGDLYFTYSLQKGICEVSSVDLILKEKGLLSSAESSTPENPKP